jgi:SpoVK/Ycf46/Vps4 family AAA+-type ATPase
MEITMRYEPTVKLNTCPWRPDVTIHTSRKGRVVTLTAKFEPYFPDPVTREVDVFSQEAAIGNPAVDYMEEVITQEVLDPRSDPDHRAMYAVASLEAALRVVAKYADKEEHRSFIREILRDFDQFLG